MDKEQRKFSLVGQIVLGFSDLKLVFVSLKIPLEEVYEIVEMNFLVLK